MLGMIEHRGNLTKTSSFPKDLIRLRKLNLFLTKYIVADFEVRSKDFKLKIRVFMKKKLIFIFVVLILSLSCGKPIAKHVSPVNASFIKVNDDSSSSTRQVRIFTAYNLTEYVEQNKVEIEKMLMNQRIMVSGVVTTVADDHVELEGINHGKVRCSGAVFYEEEWKKLQGFFTNFNKTRSKRPLATVSGIYKLSVSPKVFLEDCKIETATR
jgi:hypothetical protein